MVDLAVISGSGFYDFPGLQNKDLKILQTKYGEAELVTGQVFDKKLAFLARHGEKHTLLPNHINYKANMCAIKELGARALIATTVCGVLDPEVPLARMFIFDDLYFPENRLPDGQLCTLFDEAGDKKRGHYIFFKPFSPQLRDQFKQVAHNSINDAVYAHVNGPRFNSRAEIRMLRQYATCVSQTAGPEIVLAGELEIPSVLLGYGVDYANGVSEEPTPVEVLTQNLNQSKSVFVKTIMSVLKGYQEPVFKGFIYRFE